MGSTSSKPPKQQVVQAEDPSIAAARAAAEATAKANAETVTRKKARSLSALDTGAADTALGKMTLGG